MQNLLDDLKLLLQKDERLTSEGDLLKNKIIELAIKLDKDLLKLLLSDKKMKEVFFISIDGTLVFDKDKFLRFISNKDFLPDSYTAFKNKIGLTENDEFISEKKEVVLSWPYKDTVLEGGMTKEDQKRDEVFYNEILAPDEISRLLDPKVFINFKRMDKDGEHELKEFKRDEKGYVRDNIIIKGNNLLALASLKKQFEGQVKLIYIDPPYNTGDDSFLYNDNFNHSSWLVFMKNRFEIAQKLLSNDGAIFVQIDLHEVGYLNVLLDEVFGRENFVQLISVKTASPAGFKTVNPGPIDVTEYVFFYTKKKSEFKFKRGYVSVDYDENYNLVITNLKDDPERWILKPLANIIYEENGIEIGSTPQQSAKNAEVVWGPYWKIIRKQIMAEYALNNAGHVVSIRDPHKPTQALKTLLEKSKLERGRVFKYSRSTDEYGEENNGYVINGGALAFYSNKVKNIDGEKTSTELLTDLWVDISWDGIAGEGGVKLKNGKKPEKLLQRIIEISTEPSDLVLDYHLGSGTTCAVAHKMGRQYIGIEQLEYDENDSVVRLKNVIKEDQTGISRAVGWDGGGDFVYMELAKWNENWVGKIERAKTGKELAKLWDEMKEKVFLSYKVDPKVVDANAKEFADLSVDDQKKFLMECLDKNHLYVNYSEIDDEDYGMSEDDKKMNKNFYHK